MPTPPDDDPGLARERIARLGLLTILVVLVIAVAFTGRKASEANSRAVEASERAKREAASLTEVRRNVLAALELLREHDPRTARDTAAIDALLAALGNNPPTPAAATSTTTPAPVVVTVRPGAAGPRGPAGRDGAAAPATPTPSPGPSPDPAPTPCPLRVPLLDTCLLREVHR